MNFSEKTIAVTGAAGFKGRYICEMLKQLGATVIEYDDDGYQLQHIYHTGHDLYIHFAATTIVSECQKNPEDAINNNISALLSVLKNVRECDHGKPVLVATTDKVYKESNANNQESAELGGNCPYSVSKVAIENICELYRKFYGLNIVTVRCANVIGPHDPNLSRLIPDIMSKLKAGEPATIRNPSFKRPYIYVLDAVYAYLQIANRMLIGEPVMNAVNLCMAHHTCFDVGTMIELVSNKDINYGAPQDFKESSHLHIDATYSQVICIKHLYSIPKAIRETWHKWDVPHSQLVKEYLELRGEA